MSRVTARAITHQNQVSGYQRIAKRINELLQRPSIQARRYAYLSPAPSDHPEDWERIVDDIEVADEIRLTRIKNGNGRIRIQWQRTNQS